MAQPFERAVEEHGTTVLKVCRALLGHHDAEDAWSETFLAALRAWPDLRPGSDVRAWLVTIAHRKAIDVLRRQGRLVVVEAVTELAIEPAGRDLDLWDSLAALPDKQRAAVTLHHLAGLPYKEVGQLLETSEAAARRSAADGIANLRKVTPHV